MVKKFILIIVSIIITGLPSTLYAPWLWTKESGWMNEKDVVKESPKAQWKHAQILEGEKKYNNAIRAYKSLIKAYPTSPLAAGSQKKIALCHERKGELYEAFKAHQKLIENYPTEIDFDSVLKDEYRIGELFISGKKRKVFKLPIIPAIDKGIEIMQTVVNNAPFSEIAPRAQSKIGLAYKKTGKLTEAIDAYNKVVLDYCDTPWYEEALYQLGWCNYKKSRGAWYDQESARSAVRIFKRFQKEFPQSKQISRVKKALDELEGRQADGILKIANFYKTHKHYKAAIAYYKELVEKFSDTKEAEEANRQLQRLEKKGML